MRKIVLIFLLYLSIIKITYAIPVPALVVGWDFVVLAIPAILGIFSAIYFYFRKYIFWINIYLFVLGVFLYFYHFDLTKEVFLYKKEYLIFLIFILLFGLIYKFKKLKILNYSLVIILIGINFFLVKVDYNIAKYYQNINKFISIVGDENVNSYLIKDNFYAIYFNGNRKELVVSNCLEGVGNKGLFLKKVIKDFDKQPLENGICIYGNYGDYEFNVMYKIITNQL